MKLSEYLNLLDAGSELTCWDKDIDSEFYFYSKEPDERPDEDFPNVDACIDKLADVLDIVKIHEHGVEVNLYDLLDHPKVIQYAKDYLYEPYQYEDDDDIVMLLFDDNLSNITNGFDAFSKEMVECLDNAYGSAGNKYQISQIKDLEKHVDGAEHIRIRIAEMGIALNKFVHDESWLVRKAVAENGFGLDVLKNDPHWAVRKAVAKQGYALETLANDKDMRVVIEVRRTLKRQAFETEIAERSSTAAVDACVDALLAEAVKRSAYDDTNEEINNCELDSFDSFGK